MRCAGICLLVTLVLATLACVVPAQADAQDASEAQPFAFYDVTGDMGAFFASRYFPFGSHPYEGEGGILYLTAQELIERYSLSLDVLRSGVWLGWNIDFGLVALMVRPLSLKSASFLFRDKLIQAMRSSIGEQLRDFSFHMPEHTRALTAKEQEEFFLLGAAWSREAAACIRHIAADEECGDPVYLGEGDAAYAEEWAGLLLQSQEEPEATMRTAAQLLDDFASSLESEAENLARLEPEQPQQDI